MVDSFPELSSALLPTVGCLSARPGCTALPHRAVRLAFPAQASRQGAGHTLLCAVKLLGRAFISQQLSLALHASSLSISSLRETRVWICSQLEAGQASRASCAVSQGLLARPTRALLFKPCCIPRGMLPLPPSSQRAPSPSLWGEREVRNMGSGLFMPVSSAGWDPVHLAPPPLLQQWGHFLSLHNLWSKLMEKGRPQVLMLGSCLARSIQEEVDLSGHHREGVDLPWGCRSWRLSLDSQLSCWEAFKQVAFPPCASVSLSAKQTW